MLDDQIKYDEIIFHNYHKLRNNLQGGRCKSLDIMYKDKNYNNIYRKFYKKILEKYLVNKTDSILEIGCNQGGFLRPLYGDGYKNLYGMDLSVKDIEIARKKIPAAKLVVGNALENSSYKEEEFHVIICRAVLEHIRKTEVLNFVQKIYEHLHVGGILILDVPNMDWIWGGHERYMDFTHEGGFTKESLEEIMLIFFDKVEFIYEDMNVYDLKGKIAREILWFLFSNIGVGTSKDSIFSQSIVGVARKDMHGVNL